VGLSLRFYGIFSSFNCKNTELSAQKNKKDIQDAQMPFYDENTLTYDESPPHTGRELFSININYK